MRERERMYEEKEQEEKEKPQERVRIYFVDNHVLEIEREKAVFCGGNGLFFCLSEGLREQEMNYTEIVREGRVMVNWDNVCFVKEVNQETEEE